MSNFFEIIMDIIGWLQIVASPFLIGLGIGVLIYFSNQNNTNLIIAIGLAILGLIIGIIWATKIWKTKGSMWFVSQVSATPDLDNLNTIDNEKNSRQH